MIEIIALVLALKTRKIKIKALNDSKEIAAIVYITFIATSESLVIGIVLAGNDALIESLLSTAFIIVTSSVLGFTHIPKVKCVK